MSLMFWNDWQKNGTLSILYFFFLDVPVLSYKYTIWTQLEQKCYVASKHVSDNFIKKLDCFTHKPFKMLLKHLVITDY